MNRTCDVTEPATMPAALVCWRDVLDGLSPSDRCYTEAQTRLEHTLFDSTRLPGQVIGESRAVFQCALPGIDEGLLDEWMAALTITPVEDFIDHHLSFIRNAAQMMPEVSPDTLVRRYLTLYFLGGARQRAVPPHRRLYRGRPEVIIIEITRSCNFACTMCSSRTNGWLPERTMSPSLFRDLVAFFAPTASKIRINGYGETSLVPELPTYLDCFEAVGFARQRELITNLSSPTPLYADLLARDFTLLVSWDATTPQLFEQIRVGAKYPEMLERLRTLGRLVGSHPERLYLLCTIQELNRQEIVPLVRLAADVGAGVVLYNMIGELTAHRALERRFGEMEEYFAMADREAARLGINVLIPDHIGERPLRLPQTHRTSATFCDRPWKELMVAWNTELTVCNMFNPFSYGLFNAPTVSQDLTARFERLWNGPNAWLFRQLINTEARHPYCRECYYLYE